MTDSTLHKLPAAASDLVNLEEKVDGLAETINKTLDGVEEIKTRLTSIETKLEDLPTKGDIQKLLLKS
jgi:chromosome segregation ATPase